MTTAVTARPLPGGNPGVLALARVQTLHWAGLFVSWLGTVAVGLLGLVVLTAVTGEEPGFGWAVVLGLSLGTTALHFQTMTQFLPFSLGLGATRRRFCLATAVVVAVQSVVQSTVVTLVVQAELATGGWGLSRAVMAVGPLRRLAAAEQWAALAVATVAASMLYLFCGAVYQRWGRTALWVMLIAYVVLFPAIVIVGVLVVGSDVGAATAVLSSFPVLAGVPLALAVVLGAAAYAVARRSTP